MSECGQSQSVVSSISQVIDVISSDEFNKLKSHWFRNEVPKKCLDGPCILGVDEAGRGPVLGPMVYSVFYCPIKDTDILKTIGCTDSKALTEKKREEIFDSINNYKDSLGWAVDVISPNLISNKMQKRIKYSLNEIAQNSTIKLIESILKQKIVLKEIYVDTIGPPEKYQDKLSKLFPDSKIVVEKKADSLYPVVGAASICAKVIRDNVVQHWKYSESITISEAEMGTGYPGDPVTKKFLLENKDDVFGFPNFVRFSWSTASKSLENATEVEWEDEDENQNGTANAPKISSFFKPLTNGEKHQTSFNFFKERSLSSVDNFYNSM